MGFGPNPTSTPSSPTYVPSFPFYDAEPYWPKRNNGSGSGSGSSGDGANIGETLPYYYHVSTTDAADFFLSTSPFTDVSGKTLEQLQDMSISSVTVSTNNETLNNIDVHVSDGLYFCCVLMTSSDVAHCKVASGGYLDDYEWGSYQLDNDNIVYVTGPTNVGSDVPDDLAFITITNQSFS